mgnify:CR=1 FL=1
MTDQSTRDKGRGGEDLALAHLQKKGYVILERNYRCRYGEIDLIAKDGPTMVFVEVKSRRSNIFGSPEEAVGIAKQKKLSTVALYYLMEKHLDDRCARFDVVTVMTAEEKPEIRIIRDAFDLIR